MKKKILSTQINEDLLEKIRDIVYWEPGMSLNKFVEEALFVKSNLYIPKQRPSRLLQPGRKVS